MGEFAIGQGVSRFEDPRLLRGGGRYVDDIKLAGTAHGVVLRSQHAHAKILKSIDVSAAKAAPGVLAVLTAADFKAAGWDDLPVPGNLKRRGGAPMFKPRYPILADGVVRWVGDPVAFVVAETIAQALGRARTDRGRLRGAAGGHLYRRGGEARERRRSGTAAPTMSPSSRRSATRTRSMPPSPRPRMW